MLLFAAMLYRVIGRTLKMCLIKRTPVFGIFYLLPLCCCVVTTALGTAYAGAVEAVSKCERYIGILVACPRYVEPVRYRPPCYSPPACCLL